MSLARIWKGALAAAPLRVWAIVLAGPALSAAAAVMVGIIWRGDWPEELAGKRLDFLGWALLVLLVNVTIIIAALAAVRVKARGMAGEFEVGGSTGEQPAEQQRRSEEPNHRPRPNMPWGERE